MALIILRFCLDMPTPAKKDYAGTSKHRNAFFGQKTDFKKKKVYLDLKMIIVPGTL